MYSSGPTDCQSKQQIKQRMSETGREQRTQTFQVEVCTSRPLLWWKPGQSRMTTSQPAW
jgi:hypothetical protein